MKGNLGMIEKTEIVNLMRRVGYLSLGRGRDEAEFSFVRPLGRNGYPRFHLFVRFDKGKTAVFDIHLDQKKTVYAGTRAHMAEYDGPLLDDEIARIKNLLKR